MGETLQKNLIFERSVTLKEQRNCKKGTKKFQDFYLSTLATTMIQLYKK